MYAITVVISVPMSATALVVGNITVCKIATSCDSRVGNADFAAFLQHATDVGHEAGEHLDRLLLGYSVIIARPLGEMLQRDDRRQWPGHRSGLRSRRHGPFLGRLRGDELQHR